MQSTQNNATHTTNRNAAHTAQSAESRNTMQNTVSIQTINTTIANVNKSLHSTSDLHTMQSLLMQRENLFQAKRMLQSARQSNNADAERSALQFCAKIGITAERSTADGINSWGRIKREYGEGKQQLITLSDGTMTLGEFKPKSGHRHTATGTQSAAWHPHVMHNYKPDAYLPKQQSAPKPETDKVERQAITKADGTFLTTRCVVTGTEQRRDIAANNVVTATELFKRADAIRDAAKRTLEQLPNNADTWTKEQKKAARSARAAITRAKKIRNRASAIEHSQRIESVCSADVVSGTILLADGETPKAKAQDNAERRAERERNAAERSELAAQMQTATRISNPRKWKAERTAQRSAIAGKY